MRLSAGYRAEDFEVDGSLRDVCVLGTDVAVWERLMASVLEVPGEYKFSVDGEPADLTAFSVRRLFADDSRESTPALHLRVGELWFACFFFEPTEIEFSFGPEDLQDGVHFNSLEQFMLWLAEVCDRRVIMTMEYSSSHENAVALLETCADVCR